MVLVFDNVEKVHPRFALEVDTVNDVNYPLVMV